MNEIEKYNAQVNSAAEQAYAIIIRHLLQRNDRELGEQITREEYFDGIKFYKDVMASLLSNIRAFDKLSAETQLTYIRQVYELACRIVIHEHTDKE